MDRRAQETFNNTHIPVNYYHQEFKSSKCFKEKSSKISRAIQYYFISHQFSDTKLVSQTVIALCPGESLSQNSIPSKSYIQSSLSFEIRNSVSLPLPLVISKYSMPLTISLSTFIWKIEHCFCSSESLQYFMLLCNFKKEHLLQLRKYCELFDLLSSIK